MVFFSRTITPVKADTLADIKAAGVLVVGSDTTYPPFEEYNTTTQETTGFDVDIAQQIGIALGVKVQFKTSEWVPIIPNLNNKQFDIIISAMTITADRETQVDFSRWYYKSFQGILVAKDNPMGFTQIDDLNATGVKVGLQAGTTSDLYFNESLTLAERNAYSSLPLAIQALKSNIVDAVIGDYAVLAQDAAQSGETKLLDKLFSPEDFGIAVRTGDTALLNEINGVLNDLLGSDVNNPNPSDLYNIIYNKWFLADAPDYTGTVSTGDIPVASGAATPGFELIALTPLLFIPLIRKIRKNRN